MGMPPDKVNLVIWTVEPSCEAGAKGQLQHGRSEQVTAHQVGFTESRCVNLHQNYVLPCGGLWSALTQRLGVPFAIPIAGFSVNLSPSASTACDSA